MKLILKKNLIMEEITVESDDIDSVPQRLSFNKRDDNDSDELSSTNKKNQTQEVTLK